MFYKCLMVCSYRKVLLEKSLWSNHYQQCVDHFDSHSGHAQIPQVTTQWDNAVFHPGKAPKNIDKRGESSGWRAVVFFGGYLL